MTFLSLSFAAFAALVFAAWWGAPAKARPLVLAAANLVFALSLGLHALAALLAVSALSWAAGLWLARSPRKAALAVGCAGCLAPLLAYKYLALAAAALGWPGLFAGLAAPAGISFYTFKAVAYLAEVYKGRLRPEKSALHYFNYTGFFAQLASGPIQAPGSLLLQLAAPPPRFDRALALGGCVRLCWGLFLKKCLADPLAGYQGALADPAHYYGLSVAWALLAFSLQLYFDFASYSQLAIGLANLLGFETGENFLSPYFSRSIGEFWRRWHISLSAWLRNYIYIPLGGSRRGKARLVLATMATFLVSGAWHGAAGGFLVWGALHGVYLLAGRLTRAARGRVWAALGQGEHSPLRSAVSWAFTLLLVFGAWLFFVTGTLPAARQALAALFSPFPFSVQYLKESITLLGFTPAILVRLGLFTALTALVDWLSRGVGFGAWAAAQRPWVQAALCYVCVFASLFFGAAGALPNIYFAF